MILGHPSWWVLELNEWWHLQQLRAYSAYPCTRACVPRICVRRRALTEDVFRMLALK